jgi:glutathione S-transferase
MKLYYVPKTRATRPRWVLEELGIPHELVRLDAAKRETHAAAHLARHPLGHVPVLEDGELTFFESGAICLWLAERYPEKGLVPPPGTAARALLHQWIFYGTTELEPPLNSISGERRKPEAERDPRRIEDAKARFRAAAAPLERVLTPGPYLLGDGFTVADVVVGAILLWGRSAGALEGMPAVEGYLSRLRDRPAWRRATAD